MDKRVQLLCTKSFHPSAPDNYGLLLSFDTAGIVGGVTFADEDVLEFDPALGSWELAYDGSSQHGGGRAPMSMRSQ